MGSSFQAVPYQLRSYCFHYNWFCFVEVYSLFCYYSANPLNYSDLSDPIIVGCFSTNDLSLNVSVNDVTRFQVRFKPSC